jgi:hypothetical protein
MFAGPKTTFTHDEFVLGFALNGTCERTNNNGLKYAYLTDRDDQLRELFLAKLGARLT